MTPSTFHIAICGGGIGGLTLALVIAKYGAHSVEIFEASPDISTIGAGLAFYTRSLEIMKSLGLYDDIVKMAIRPPLENTGVSYRKSDQRDGYQLFTRDATSGQLTVHRKDLMDLLLREIPNSCKIHTSKRLEFYRVDPDTGKVILHFADGSTAAADVLAGADGVRSATRKTMYQDLASLAGDDDLRKQLLDCVDPAWTGLLAYRSLIPTEKLVKEYPDAENMMNVTAYLGKNKHIVTYPISQGRLVNIIAYIHNRDMFGKPFDGRWEQDVSENEILDQFEEWEDRVRVLVKCIEKSSRWALHSVRPLPHYAAGKVVLLGDAAHAMEPHLGAGAGQAMQDAFVLGRLLTHELTHQGNIIDALQVYEDICIPVGNSAVKRSRDTGRYCGLHYASPDSGPLPDKDSTEYLNHVQRAIEEEWKWQAEPAWVWGEAEEQWRMKCNSL